MGYAYQIINRVTPDVERVTGSLLGSWKKAGLDVSAPEDHEEGGLKLTVRDPDSGRALPLRIAEYTALADGHWQTGSEVKVSSDTSSPDYSAAKLAFKADNTNFPDGMRLAAFNEIALNKPEKSLLARAMQGEPQDQTEVVAESIRLYIRTGRQGIIRPEMN